MRRRDFIQKLGAGAALGIEGLAEPGVAAATQERKEKATLWGSMDPRVVVNLDSIGWNLARVKEKAGVPVMAVVKANAYGHGLVETGRYLEKRGVEALMTGKLEEAVRLRESGARARIVNFGPFGTADATEIVDRRIGQSVSSEDGLSLGEAASRLGKRAEVDIHVDTGMNRAGVPAERALPLIEKLAGSGHLRIRGISTTLIEDPAFDEEQLGRFLDICEAARKRGIDVGLRHAASSAGLFSGPRFFLDMVRPGIALYGYYPNARTRKEDALGLKPALKLTARVTFIADLAPGESISYLRAIKAERPMRVAAVGIGYSDGYPPQLGGKGFVRIGSGTFPVLPAVTSNHVMIDLGDDRSVKVGDEVVLIDNEKSSGLGADALSGLCGVSDYKILIGLNPLLPREYA